MNTITISIAYPILAEHPDATVVAFAAGNLLQAARTLENQGDPFAGVGDELKRQGITMQNLADDPRIKGWRTAISACGLKPSRYKGSAEQLVRRTLSSGGVTTPLPIVTTYCAISAKHMAPMGAYDTHRLPTSCIKLRRAAPATDRFAPLGGQAEDMPLTEQTAVYASGPQVICYAYNHRDSRDTCLTETTDQAVFVGEAVEQCHITPLKAAIAELSDRLAGCGAIVSGAAICDKDIVESIIRVPTLCLRGCNQAS